MEFRIMLSEKEYKELIAPYIKTLSFIDTAHNSTNDLVIKTAGVPDIDKEKINRLDTPEADVRWDLYDVFVNTALCLMNRIVSHFNSNHKFEVEFEFGGFYFIKNEDESNPIYIADLAPNNLYEGFITVLEKFFEVLQEASKND